MVWGSNPSGDTSFLSFHPSRLALRPTHLLYGGYWASIPGVKWPGHSVDHPPSSRDEAKNE